ncbi:MAG TPA: hemolysin family protein [Thermoleophilia bacterium]|nr:hemolysin family protein [Thermoleophilia bacterium]
MSVAVPLLVIAALILLNALFVAAEFAFVGAPRSSIARRAAEGDRRARRVHAILRDSRNQDRYLATAQLGITVASLGLGMYGERVVAAWLVGPLEALGADRLIAAHAIASVIAVALLTYVHIVLGEMVPKSLALQGAERAALALMPIMTWVRIALFPLVVVLNAIGNGLLRLMGVARQSGSVEQYHTAEELRFVVRESLEGGKLGRESGRVVQELLAFGDLTAGEVLMPRVLIEGIPLGATSDDLAERFSASPHTRYPVYREDLDDIIGILHVKDVLRLALAGEAVTEAHVRAIPYLPETAHLDAVLMAMRREHTQLAIILDEHGGTAGMLTIEDLFEEVVGEINEGGETPQTWTGADGRLHVAGTVRIDEVGDLYDSVLEHEEVDTVSGLVLMLLDRPPQIGDVVIYANVAFEVTQVEGHGVAECVVTPLATDGVETTDGADPGGDSSAT